MSGRRRRRVDCPVCGRSVALTPSGKIGPHMDPGSTSSGFRCDAVGTLTARDAHRADLRRLAELIWAYPEQARKMVRRLPP